MAPLPPITTLALGTKVVLPEVPVTVRLPAAVSTSPTVKAIAPVLASSLMLWALGVVTVGESLLAATVTLKVSVTVKVPSETVRVMVAVPF